MQSILYCKHGRTFYNAQHLCMLEKKGCNHRFVSCEGAHLHMHYKRLTSV